MGGALGIESVRCCSRQRGILALVVGFVGFRCPGVGFAPCRCVAQRALGVHVHVDIVCTVIRQCVWASPLCVYLVRVFADGIWYKQPAASTRGVWERALCDMCL